MQSNTEPKVWLITGASSGLGRAIADAAARRGDRVFATARSPERLSDLLSRHPGLVRSHRLDVADPAQIDEAVAAALASMGRVDVMVNNAGYGVLGALEELAPEQIERNLRTNLLGPIRLMRALLPAMRRQGGGTIVNISAAAAIHNYPGFSVYGAGKAGLEAAGDAVAAEAAPMRVRVIAVQPGPFRTDFIARNVERAASSVADYAGTSGKFAALISGMSGKQPGDPAKAADAILRAVDSDKPPARLVLGKYAIAKARKRAQVLAAELDAWEPIVGPTEY
ncbi:SDR family NAD(P)-dependent oxidoreductase [Leptolyngbya sp. 15MV]|nr:SDR family NAD(P)-dependent oxidoreductase [Leptolyngbya sp. 15MV]